MNLTIGRDAFLAALERAGKVVEKRNSIPILGNLLLRAADGRLVVTGTDLDMQVTAQAEATMSSKLIDGTFPDYRRVIPSGNSKIATLARAALAGSADRVATLSADRSRAIKFAFSAEGLTLSVRNADAGDATDEVDLSYVGPPLEIGFNAGYVLDVLRVLPGTMTRMALADPGSPCLITSEEHADCRFVIMPMRV